MYYVKISLDFIEFIYIKVITAYEIISFIEDLF